ncbi:MAG TPA: DnaA/Hda family protein [Candidatus Hydrogenedentes bacterium]|nr:DnaA/Hda family protein [Candidatus Hydrogenedentota bacterium]HRT21449.1 DnaA/Hda family protein [Candidatus Hydrogenedentota bacterium]HRT63947.1 DnaA/Hda family protein [Candidatus Hydrogenedentota bacterium]
MRRFEFSTFQVDDGNRAAFELCHAVSELQPVSPLPVVIVSEPGRGKTHLLYAIVNALRERSPRTALAYITAREFPDKARALIEDPTPLERAASAVLLVDQLERFTERLVDLEAIVRAFLDRGHYVLLASCLPPNRLPHFPPGLRNMLEKGQIVSIGNLRTPTPAAKSPENMRIVSPPQDEIQRLREELARLEQKAAALPSTTELERQIERERARTKDLQEQVESQRAAEEELAQQLGRAQEELRTVRRDLDKAREEAGRVAALEDEVKRLSDHAAHLQSEQEANERVRAALMAQLAEKSAVAEELHTAQVQCRIMSEEHAAADADWTRRAEALLAAIEACRARFSITVETAGERIEQLEKRLNEGA